VFLTVLKSRSVKDAIAAAKYHILICESVFDMVKNMNVTVDIHEPLFCCLKPAVGSESSEAGVENPHNVWVCMRVDCNSSV
jgi:hypothetical protein